MVKSLVLKLSELEQQIEDINRQIIAEQAKQVASVGGEEKLAEIVNWLGAIQTDTEFRKTVQDWLRGHVERIELDKGAKSYTLTMKNQNVFTFAVNGISIT
jgi:hypothetical protein